MGEGGQGPGRRMRLQARDPVAPDDGVVARPGGQLKAIPGVEVNGRDRLREAEPDGARRDHDDLVEGVGVRTVPIARFVGPGSWIKAVVRQASPESRRIRHRGQPAIVTPMTDPIRYVTVAAARPMPS